MTALAFVVAAAVGAAGRYVVDFAISERSRHLFPWGTFWVNVAGSFVLGAVAGAAARGLVSPELRLVAGTGFCGAFTTFSTFAYETMRLYEEGSRLQAALNAAASFAAGLAACAGGLALAAHT